MRGIHVGLGGRARSWIPVCERRPEVEMIAYVEPVADNRRAAQEQHSLPEEQLFVSIEDALKAVGDEADFVLDTTPPAAHETIATQSFAAGLHVIQEKPMSVDFPSARRMVAAAEAAGKTFMVTQNYRFAPVPRTTRRLVEEGSIGAVQTVDMGFYRAWATRPGTHYTSMPYPLVTDMGIHHFDLLRYVLGADPMRVRCTTWNPPWGWHRGDAAHNLTIEFEGGVIAMHHANGASVGKQSPWHGDLRLEGPEGSLTWEENAIYRTHHPVGGEASREELPLDEVATGQDGLLAVFVEALLAGREPECSGQDNLKSLAIVFAAIQSATEGRPVEIAELFAD